MIDRALDVAGGSSPRDAGARAAWSALLAERRDPREIVIARRKDGTEGHAPLGIRLAQAIHHGTDHRSQICTGLSGLGIEPPDIDVWAFGEQQGTVFDAPISR